MQEFNYYHDLIKKLFAGKNERQRYDVVANHARKLFPDISDEMIQENFPALRFKAEADLMCANCTGFAGECPFFGRPPRPYIDKDGGYIVECVKADVCSRYVPLKNDTDTNGNGSRHREKSK